MKNIAVITLRTCLVALWPFTTMPAAEPGPAMLQMPAIFADNMILQRETPCHIWGRGKPGATVAVTFNGQEKSATVDAQGGWSMRLDAMTALAQGTKLAIKDGTSEKSFSNVVVGDVWVCGGQSNMGVGIETIQKVAPEFWQNIVATTDFPNLRYLSVKETLSPFQEKADIETTGWAPLSKQADLSRIRPSAIGFLFARSLHRELNIPVGFIRSNIGGSGAEAWMSMDTLRASKAGKVILAEWAAVQKNYGAEKAQKYVAERYAEAEKSGDKKLMAQWKNPGAWPKEPVQSRSHPNTGFNGMIAPITKFTIKGFIWDQGEFNADRAWQYRELLPLVISDWRTYWRQGNGEAAAALPFYMVQLQDWGRPSDPAKQAPANGDRVAELRDAQRHVADAIPGCALVVTVDQHEGGNTHPLLKNIPGERLAALALVKTYGKDLPWRGPTFRDMKVEGRKVRILFDGVGQGLMVGKRVGANVKATPVPEPLARFAIAGEDNAFVWATAAIDGDTVVVSSDKVAAPKHVRYAWEGNPDGCNLYNKDGWPATPFRTDDLPYVTKDREKSFRNPTDFVWH